MRWQKTEYDLNEWFRVQDDSFERGPHSRGQIRHPLLCQAF